MVISKDKIAHYIPTKYPFILVDNLLDFKPDVFISNFHVTSNNLFIEKGKLREYALVENIAQTASVGIILRNKTSELSYTDGYIGGIKKFFLYALPKLNDTIITKVEVITQLGTLHLIKGNCYVDEQKIFECELKLAGKEQNA